MTLSERVAELKKVKSQVKSLYRKMKAIENEIIKELDNFDLKDGEKQKITIDDIVELAITYESRIDADKVRDLHPSVYNYGQRLYFDWREAVLSFENPNEFWVLMSECRNKERKVKVKVKRERTNRGTRQRN